MVIAQRNELTSGNPEVNSPAVYVNRQRIDFGKKLVSLYKALVDLPAVYVNRLRINFGRSRVNLLLAPK